MGFGILFFGYFLTFAFVISEIYFFADVLGCVVMLYAFSKLREYNRYFTGAVASCAVFAVLALTGALGMLFKFFPEGSALEMALDIAKALAACAVHIFIFLGTRGISLGAECTKLVRKSERNLKMTLAYYIISLFVLATSPLYAEVAPYISGWVMLYWIVCLVFNLALIYQAFGLLYPADEDQTEKKRSRFKIINYMNEKMDAFEANANKYRRESMEMALEEAEKRRLEKEKQHPKKKKKKK